MLVVAGQSWVAIASCSVALPAQSPGAVSPEFEQDLGTLLHQAGSNSQPPPMDLSGISLGAAVDTTTLTNQPAFLGNDPQATFKDLMKKHDISADIQQSLLDNKVNRTFFRASSLEDLTMDFSLVC